MVCLACMGDLQVLVPQPDGILNDASPQASALPPCTASFPDLQLPAIDAENFHAAEVATREVVNRIQPTVVSEERRKAVVGYVQRLVRGYLGTELFPFGSVPLKTYLPDGDIDLTALSSPNAEESLCGDVYNMLEAEEHNQFAEFEVKDVQYIHAEVKLVKCLIHNIVVDISFNQLGGLGTLCFLEQVDRLVGKESLFKRSIILIKAWCYYESRVLGAHHGLISTYALEALVLYIFHFYHSSLDGPLAVLFRFLDYFSKFDWENYCLSLHGPVSASSLSGIAVDMPENDSDNLLLTKDFLKNCKEMTAIPPRLLETRPRPFPWKHLNIIDPMKENNNLGRSVSKGNLYRIRSAFTYGARRLEKILLSPPENIGDDVKKFFQNTMDRHGNGQRPDAQDLICHAPFGVNGGSAYSDAAHSEKSVENDGHNVARRPSTSSSGDGSTSGDVMVGHKTESMDKGKRSISDEASSDSECACADHRNCIGCEGNANGALESSGQASSEGCKRVMNIEISLSEKSTSVSPLSYLENFSSTPRPFDRDILRPYPFTEEFVASRPYISFFRENTASHFSLASKTSSNPSNGDVHCPPEGFGFMADLSGDYDYQLKSLLYAQYCHEYIWGAPVLPIPSQTLHGFLSYASWDAPHYLQPNRDSFSHVSGIMNGRLFSPGPVYYPVTGPALSGAFNIEEMPKPRGTGTYFPNTDFQGLHTYKERQSPGRGRNGIPGQSPICNNYSKTRSDVRLGSPSDHIVVSESGNQQTQLPPSPLIPPLPSPSHSPSHVSSPSQQLGSGHSKRSGPKDFFSGLRPVANGSFHSDGSAKQLEVAFGTSGPMQLGKVLHDQSRHADIVSPKASSNFVDAAPTTGQRSGWSTTQGRVSQTYHLKNDEDFPPLA